MKQKEKWAKKEVDSIWKELSSGRGNYVDFNVLFWLAGFEFAKKEMLKCPAPEPMQNYINLSSIENLGEGYMKNLKE